MNVVTKKINNYEAVIYKTKKYTTIHLDYIFLNEFTHRNFIIFDLLNRYMLNTNSKYKTKKEIDELISKYYSFYIQTRVENYTDDLIITLSIELINPKLVKDDYFDKLIKELHTLIFKPNFKDGKLDKKTITTLKKEMINEFESKKTNIFRQAREDFLNSVFKDTFYTRLQCSLDEYKDIMSNITDKDIIDTYNTLINKSFKRLYILGDITSDNLESLKKIKFKHITDKELVFNKVQIKPISDYVEFKFKGEESTIKSLYEVKDYNKEDEFALLSISKILNSSGRILQKVFRNDLKIVYYSGGYINMKLGYLVIEADIDAKNKDIFIDGLDKVFAEFNNKELVEESLQSYKDHLKDTLYILDENKFGVKFNFLDKYLYNDYTYEELYENIKKVTYEDIMRVINKLERRIIHFANATDN